MKKYIQSQKYSVLFVKMSYCSEGQTEPKRNGMVLRFFMSHNLNAI